MPGTPPSVTCSVHTDPDQYRFSCRPEGSVSQPGAIPVKVTSPGAVSTESAVRLENEESLNEFAADELLGPLGWRRCDVSARTAKRPKNRTKAIQEAWP